MHMAIGYFLVTGKPQAVMVHVNVARQRHERLAHAARGHWRCCLPPAHADQRRRLEGHRSLDIHWTQEMFDQAGIAAESVKWGL